TQALMDQLNLTHTDAERMKREMGDALPPEQEAAPVQHDAPVAVDAGEEIAEIDDAAEAPASAEESSDPFDIDIFNQGAQEEPGEQHQQKMPNGNEDDLPSKSSPDEPAEEGDTTLP